MASLPQGVSGGVGGTTDTHPGKERNCPWQGAGSLPERAQAPASVQLAGRPGHAGALWPRASPASPGGSRPPVSAGPRPHPGRWLHLQPPQGQSERCGSSRRAGRSAAACGACGVGCHQGQGPSLISWCRERQRLPGTSPLPGTGWGLLHTSPHPPRSV